MNEFVREAGASSGTAGPTYGALTRRLPAGYMPAEWSYMCVWLSWLP